jgi:hypothetical protein
MMFLNALLLVVIAAHQVVADDYVPDCYNCDYHNNIGYVKSPEYCRVYAMCTRNPYKQDDYKFTIMCCDEGQEFNVDLLTCEWAKSECTDFIGICPVFTLPPEVVCPYFPNLADPREYFVPSQELVRCPPGELWNQAICGCEPGPDIHDVERCQVILDFNFNDGYPDSYSCNNYAAGELHGDPGPVLADDVLCLNGDDQFFAIPFLNNYLAENPAGLAFSLEFFFVPANEGDTNGLFVFNCFYEKDNLFAVGHFNGEFGYSIAGGEQQFFGYFSPIDQFSHVALTYNAGLVTVYLNGAFLAEVDLGYNVLPANSQIAASLGYINGYPNFAGYIDDFRFYTIVLDDNDVQFLANEGPSNEYFL